MLHEREQDFRFLLPTTTECWIVSGARWCWMGARKNWCWIGARWKKGDGCEREQDFKFFAPHHYGVLDSVWCRMVLDRCQKKLVLDRYRIGVRWEKVPDASASGEHEREWRTRARVENASASGERKCEQDFKFFAPHHY